MNNRGLDTKGSNFHAQGFYEAVQRKLARAVISNVGKCDKTAYRPNEDDPAVSLPAHNREDRADDASTSEEVCLELQFRLVDRCVLQRAREADAGTMHKRIYPTFGACNLVDSGVHRGIVRDVHLEVRPFLQG